MTEDGRSGTSDSLQVQTSADNRAYASGSASCVSIKHAQPQHSRLRVPCLVQLLVVCNYLALSHEHVQLLHEVHADLCCGNLILNFLDARRQCWNTAWM